MNFWYIDHYGASVGDDVDAKKNKFLTNQMVIQRLPLYIDQC